MHSLFNFSHCLHLLFPISLPSVSLPLCTSVISSQFSRLSSYSNLVLGPDSSVSYTIESHITSSFKAPICTWLWVCITFVTCWSECSECPLLLIWPYHSCVIFLDGYKHFSNTLRFPVTNNLLSYSETMVHVPPDYFLFLNMPPRDFPFFFNCNFSIKPLTAVPFLSVQIPDCTSSLSLSAVDHQLGFALFFALEFTYCSS